MLSAIVNPLRGRPHSEAALRRTGFMFTLPFAAYILVWICIPAGYGLWISLTNNSLIGPSKYVGLSNYGSLLKSSAFWSSVDLTGQYMAWVVPVTLVVAFTGAYSISRVRRGGALFSTIFFIPYIIPAVASAIVFELLLPQGGLIDQVFHLHIAWLTTPGDSMIALSLTTAWSLMGFYVLIFFAGIQSLPRAVLEAAEIDGTSTMQRLWRVELPLLRPTIIFAIVTSIAYVFTKFYDCLCSHSRRSRRHNSDPAHFYLPIRLRVLPSRACLRCRNDDVRRQPGVRWYSVLAVREVGKEMSSAALAISATSGGKRRRRRYQPHFVSYTILLIIGAFCVVPIVWAVSASLHTNTNVYVEPFSWLPNPLHFANYANGWEQTDFGAAMLRSLGIALFLAIASVAFGLMATYGLTKFRFRGRKIIFATTVAVLLVPFPSIMVPVFIMTREMGLVNSYAGVIVPRDLQSTRRISDASVSPGSSGRDDTSSSCGWCE